MKTQIAFPLLYALSFLMVSFGSGSAQNPAYPYAIALTFDSAFISHDLNQTTPVTVRGSIKDMSNFGSIKMTVNITNAKQWVISTRIGGSAVNDGDFINLPQGGTLPVEITVVPYAENADTESYCLQLSMSPTYLLSHQCITLAMTKPNSAVSTDLLPPNITLVPNPAGSYIFVNGPNDKMAGYRYEIYSISAAEIRHGMLPADARINIQDLSSGTYRLLLYDGKRTVNNTAFTVVH